MKKLTLFYLASCPYCKQAFGYLDELFSTGNYSDIELEKIEESKEPELADQYDYYFVPTFYYNDEKLHEGICKKEDIERVLEQVKNA
jgi:Thioredoxin.